MTINYVMLWRRLESILTEALDLERSRIGLEESGFVSDYIDHNEFGLAHDQLVHALSDLELSPLETTRMLLNEAAYLMGATE